MSRLWINASRGLFDPRRMDLSESPVERRFAEALVSVGRALWNDCVPFYALVAQPDFTWCRPDFAVCKLEDMDRLPVLEMLLIEIDGHDFHEKTRDQVELDKKRDRLWCRKGVRTLRFTGREVNRRAHECAAEVIGTMFPADDVENRQQMLCHRFDVDPL